MERRQDGWRFRLILRAYKRGASPGALGSGVPPTGGAMVERLRGQRRSLARRVREERERLGITQAEAGRRAGVSQATVCRVESGYYVPSVETRRKLRRWLGEV